jgi:hypothetical protein
VRVVPKFAERTDLHMIEITSQDAAAEPASPAASGTVADALRDAGVPSTSDLDREFFSWYWSLMAEA